MWAMNLEDIIRTRYYIIQLLQVQVPVQVPVPDSLLLREIMEMYEEPSRDTSGPPFIYIVAAKAIINFSPLYLRFTQES